MTTKRIRILLIEDNRLLREGISELIKKQPDMNVVTTVGNGENILALIDKQKPDSSIYSYLPDYIKNIEISVKGKMEKLKEFHHLVFKYYTEIMDNEGNSINKMKQFWIYFSYNFPEQKKSFKLINKANGRTKYQIAVKTIFGK